jgi:hypothetical protein
MDPTLLTDTGRAELVVGAVAKHPLPLLVRDKPWEGPFLNMMAQVIFDPVADGGVGVGAGAGAGAGGGKYKLWYWSTYTCVNAYNSRDAGPCTPVNSSTVLSCNAKLTPHQRMANRTSAVLYAESVDGISWIKPDLHMS